jgi:SAM-dependent methyltransferase
MKQLDTYLNLCTQVYDLSKPKPPEEEYGFYKSYAEQASGAILEPMCGTGRFLLPLLQDGFQVEGSDASQYMLDALHKKAEVLKLKPTVWQGYAQETPDSKSYSLIFIPSGSFGLITENDDIKATLKAFYECLDDDGVLLFEAETKHSVPETGVWRGSKWKRSDGKTILFSICTSMDDNICSVIGKYELIDGNNIIKTEIEEYNIRIYDSTELLKTLKEVGFKNIKTVKSFDRKSPPGDDDKWFIYECRK